MPTLDPWASAEEKEAFYAKMAELVELEKSADKYEYDLKENVPADKYGNYYQIFVYSYCDSNGDGVGDLNGITSKLDYIKDMGFSGIWLTPIFEAKEYHKYHTTNYMDIDPQFGTMADFEKLVAECNKRG
ncbi:MAG: alpha amylase, partial [Lachnospiraceae bacterium]|nr:alpha amylase [Lachnospiraceae bacterium]